MKDLTPIRGRKYIRELILEGEHEHQDFKFAISDARKIARSISAFANNDGGRLLVGVKDNGVVAGIRSEEEVYMIETAAQTFCSPPVEVEMTMFKADQGLLVLRASIPKTLRPPVRVIEADGRLEAYFRVCDENMHAPEYLQRAWDYISQGDGMLVTYDDRHRQLLEMIEDEGSMTFERYITSSHSSRHQAVDLIGRLLATNVIALHHNGIDFTLIPGDAPLD